MSARRARRLSRASASRLSKSSLNGLDGPFRVLIMRASSGAAISENSLKIKELDEIKDCIGGGFG